MNVQGETVPARKNLVQFEAMRHRRKLSDYCFKSSYGTGQDFNLMTAALGSPVSTSAAKTEAVYLVQQTALSLL